MISTEVSLLILRGESQLEQSYNLDCEPVYQLKVKLALGFCSNRLLFIFNDEQYFCTQLTLSCQKCDFHIFFFARGHFESLNVEYRLYVKQITMEKTSIFVFFMNGLKCFSVSYTQQTETFIFFADRVFESLNIIRKT